MANYANAISALRGAKSTVIGTPAQNYVDGILEGTAGLLELLDAYEAKTRQITPKMQTGNNITSTAVTKKK